MDETRAEGEMAGVYAVAQEVFKREIVLITSVIVNQEIQPADLSTEERERFNRVFDRSNVKRLQLTGPIATKAGQLGHHYKNLGDGRPGLSHNDSQHLATAIIYKAAEFHTFDEKDKKGGRGRGLLTLNMNVAGYPLRIVKPGTNQPVLDLRLPGT
jgi:predicted nucleic acid-binding protein